MGLITLESWWNSSVAGFQSESFGSALMRTIDGWPVSPTMIGGVGRSLAGTLRTPAVSVVPQMAGSAMCAAKDVLFRGGSSLEARLGADVIAAADGLIHPLRNNGKAQGLSINLDKLDKYVQLHGGAFPVNYLPNGLQALQSGKPGHFVIAPASPMSFERYQQLLNQVQLGNFSRIP